MNTHRLSHAFENVYSMGRWANGSGSGSAPENTASYRSFLQDFITRNDVRSVVDLGCGDWQSSKLIDWRGAHYIGYDVVNDLVVKNRQRYSRAGVEFEYLDDEARLPAADLLLVKDVLQHLPNSEVDHVADVACRYTHVLVTNTVSSVLSHVDGSSTYMPDVNTDIAVGKMRPVDVLREPFGWPGHVVHRYMSYRSAYRAWEVKSTALVQYGNLVTPDAAGQTTGHAADGPTASTQSVQSP